MVQPTCLFISCFYVNIVQNPFLSFFLFLAEINSNSFYRSVLFLTLSCLPVEFPTLPWKSQNCPPPKPVPEEAPLFIHYPDLLLMCLGCQIARWLIWFVVRPGSQISVFMATCALSLVLKMSRDVHGPDTCSGRPGRCCSVTLHCAEPRRSTIRYRL